MDEVSKEELQKAQMHFKKIVLLTKSRLDDADFVEERDGKKGLRGNLINVNLPNRSVQIAIEIPFEDIKEIEGYG